MAVDAENSARRSTLIPHGIQARSTECAKCTEFVQKPPHNLSIIHTPLGACAVARMFEITTDSSSVLQGVKAIMEGRLPGKAGEHN